jgi:hypothetical protein
VSEQSTDDTVSVDRVVLYVLVVIVHAIGPKVHVFKSGRRRWIFKGDKNPQHAFLWIKVVGPIS